MLKGDRSRKFVDFLFLHFDKLEEYKETETAIEMKQSAELLWLTPTVDKGCGVNDGGHIFAFGGDFPHNSAGR